MARFGISVPLTISTEIDADVRSVGHDVHNALLLSQEILGTKHELIVCDNENSLEKMESITAHFEELKPVGILGIPTSREVKTTAPSLKSKTIPIITSMATSPELADFYNVFRTRADDGHAARTLLPYILDMNYRRIGTISEDNDYPNDCTKALAKLGASRGLTFVNKVFPNDDLTITKQLEELAAAEVDAVFVSTQGEYGFYQVLVQLRDIVGEVPVLGSAMPGSRKFLELAGEQANGIVYVSEPQLIETLTPFGRDFIAKYHLRYGAPETGDYTVASSFASFFALHKASKAGSDVFQNLSQLWFDDPVNGGFCFQNRAITSNPPSNQDSGSNHFAEHKIKRISNGQSLS